jgi:LysR family transcriptional regulator, hydrogen peroxide-inducible genes activator
VTPLPTPQQLRYLLALAEHQHFGRAAEACAVTQSTLSAGLIALERQLDTRLLDRDASKRVVFTSLGREIVGRARTALAALEAVAEAADAARAPMSGPLRLGVIPTIGPFLLPRLMPALRAAFPRLRLFLREDTTARLVDRLHGGQLDLALLALPCACAGAETLVVSRDPFVAAVPPDHPLAARAEVPVAALAADRLLLLEDGHCLRDQALSACGFARGEGPADLADGFAATSLHTLVQMVAGGLGVTLLPQLAVDAGITAGTDLALRKLAGPGAWRSLGLSWRPNAPRAGEYRALGAVLASTISGSSRR